jgi:hypothetical protein
VAITGFFAGTDNGNPDHPIVPAPVRRRDQFLVKQLWSRYCVPFRAGAGGFDGAGVNNCGEDVPEPVVLGGVAFRAGVLAVVEVAEPLAAVLLSLFRPATTRNPIKSSTAMPAIQPHVPPTLSSRRMTGSLNRGSLYRGSVKRGSVMTSSLVRDALRRPEWRKPAARHCGSEI